MLRAKAVSDLEEHLGYWLRVISNGVSHGFARKLEGNDVTVAEWAFMRALFDVDERSPTALADRLGMTKGAVTKLADRLIAKGFVDRAPDRDDKRAQILGLTPLGRKKVPALAALADENDAAFFGFLGRGERETLERLLKKIAGRRALRNVPID